MRQNCNKIAKTVKIKKCYSITWTMIVGAYVASFARKFSLE